jgi:hypothetical protein
MDMNETSIPPARKAGIFKFESKTFDAADLDRFADCLLQAGFHRQAERLAGIAAELREIAR